MNILCKIFGHHWNGCRCTRCNASRDEGHEWDGCSCKKCSRIRDEEHDWDGCKCRICGRVRSEGHDWDGCKCRICGRVRSEGHDWDGCMCIKCHTWRDVEHELVDGVCKKCGETITAYECTSCKKPLSLVKRKRGTMIAICVDCFRRAKVVGSHRLISYNAPNQWDQEVICVNCGKTMSYYDNGASYGVDFAKTPCR